MESGLQCGNDSGAAGAEALGVGLGGVHPAARALRAGGFGDVDQQAGEVCARADDRVFITGIEHVCAAGAVRDDEQLGEVHAADRVEGRLRGLVLGQQEDLGLQRLADALFGSFAVPKSIIFTQKSSSPVLLSFSFPDIIIFSSFISL